MSSIATICARIEQKLFAHESVAPASFYPPLSRARVHELLSSANLKPSEDLLELYAWRNGQDMEALWRHETLPFFDGFFFLPLEVALQRCPKPVPYHPDWNPAWFPILDDYSGDCYFLDLSKPGRCPVGDYATTSGEMVRADMRYECLADLLLEVEWFWSGNADRY